MILDGLYLENEDGDDVNTATIRIIIFVFFFTHLTLFRKC